MYVIISVATYILWD